MPDAKKKKFQTITEKINLGLQPKTKAELLSCHIIDQNFMRSLTREEQIAERKVLEAHHKYIMASCPRWPGYEPPPSDVFKRGSDTGKFLLYVKKRYIISLYYSFIY